MSRTRTYNKYDVEDIAVKASKLSSGFRGRELGGPSLIRRAVGQKLIKALKDPARNGHRGRPATRYTMTLKARSIARKAS